MKNFFLWLRYVGWMYLAALVVLVSIGFGMYFLATASPITKLTVTLGGIVLYNISGQFAKYFKALIPVVLVVMPITVYSLFLTAFIVPWYATLVILSNFLLAIGIIILIEMKREYIYLAYARNILFFTTVGYLAYFLFTLL